MEEMQAKKNPLDEAYIKMCEVRSYLGKAGYAIGNAKTACRGIVGIDTFINDLTKIGAKIAYMLGDCIGFCDNQAKRIENERIAKMKAIEMAKREERLAKENVQKVLPPLPPTIEKPEPKMAVVEDEKATKRRGRKNAK